MSRLRECSRCRSILDGTTMQVRGVTCGTCRAALCFVCIAEHPCTRNVVRFMKDYLIYRKEVREVKS